MPIVTPLLRPRAVGTSNSASAGSTNSRRSFDDVLSEHTERSQQMEDAPPSPPPVPVLSPVAATAEREPAAARERVSLLANVLDLNRAQTPDDASGGGDGSTPPVLPETTSARTTPAANGATKTPAAPSAESGASKVHKPVKSLLKPTLLAPIRAAATAVTAPATAVPPALSASPKPKPIPVAFGRASPPPPPPPPLPPPALLTPTAVPPGSQSTLASAATQICSFHDSQQTEPVSIQSAEIERPAKADNPAVAPTPLPRTGSFREVSPSSLALAVLAQNAQPLLPSLAVPPVPPKLVAPKPKKPQPKPKSKPTITPRNKHQRSPSPVDSPEPPSPNEFNMNCMTRFCQSANMPFAFYSSDERDDAGFGLPTAYFEYSDLDRDTIADVEHCWEVASIIDRRGQSPYQEYLVAWKPHDGRQSPPSWEPRINLIDCKKSLTEFHRKWNRQIGEDEPEDACHDGESQAQIARTTNRVHSSEIPEPDGSVESNALLRSASLLSTDLNTISISAPELVLFHKEIMRGGLKPASPPSSTSKGNRTKQSKPTGPSKKPTYTKPIPAKKEPARVVTDGVAEADFERIFGRPQRTGTFGQRYFEPPDNPLEEFIGKNLISPQGQRLVEDARVMQDRLDDEAAQAGRTVEKPPLTADADTPRMASKRVTPGLGGAASAEASSSRQRLSAAELFRLTAKAGLSDRTVLEVSSGSSSDSDSSDAEVVTKKKPSKSKAKATPKRSTGEQPKYGELFKRLITIAAVKLQKLANVTTPISAVVDLPPPPPSPALVIKENSPPATPAVAVTSPPTVLSSNAPPVPSTPLESGLTPRNLCDAFHDSQLECILKINSLWNSDSGRFDSGKSTKPLVALIERIKAGTCVKPVSPPAAKPKPKPKPKPKSKSKPKGKEERKVKSEEGTKKRKANPPPSPEASPPVPPTPPPRKKSKRDSSPSPSPKSSSPPIVLSQKSTRNARSGAESPGGGASVPRNTRDMGTQTDPIPEPVTVAMEKGSPRLVPVPFAGTESIQNGSEVTLVVPEYAAFVNRHAAAFKDLKSSLTAIDALIADTPLNGMVRGRIISLNRPPAAGMVPADWKICGLKPKGGKAAIQIVFTPFGDESRLQSYLLDSTKLEAALRRPLTVGSFAHCLFEKYPAQSASPAPVKRICRVLGVSPSNQRFKLSSHRALKVVYYRTPPTLSLGLGANGGSPIFLDASDQVHRVLSPWQVVPLEPSDSSLQFSSSMNWFDALVGVNTVDEDSGPAHGATSDIIKSLLSNEATGMPPGQQCAELTRAQNGAETVLGLITVQEQVIEHLPVSQPDRIAGFGIAPDMKGDDLIVEPPIDSAILTFRESFSSFGRRVVDELRAQVLAAMQPSAGCGATAMGMKWSDFKANILALVQQMLSASDLNASGNSEGNITAHNLRLAIAESVWEVLREQEFAAAGGERNDGKTRPLSPTFWMAGESASAGAESRKLQPKKARGI